MFSHIPGRAFSAPVMLPTALNVDTLHGQRETETESVSLPYSSQKADMASILRLSKNIDCGNLSMNSCGTCRGASGQTARSQSPEMQRTQGIVGQLTVAGQRDVHEERHPRGVVVAPDRLHRPARPQVAGVHRVVPAISWAVIRP